MSQELVYDELIHQESKFEGGVIGWDEPSLWLFSRNFQSRMNKIISQIIILMGHVEMNYYFATQFLSLLDKNIRLQMDALIFCSDLSFKYPQLQRGSTIGQLLQDMSGRFTGDMYENTGEVYQQTFFLNHSGEFTIQNRNLMLWKRYRPVERLDEPNLRVLCQLPETINIAEEEKGILVLRNLVEGYKATWK